MNTDLTGSNPEIADLVKKLEAGETITIVPEVITSPAAEVIPPVVVVEETKPPEPTEAERIKALEDKLAETENRYKGLRNSRDERFEQQQKDLDALKAEQAKREQAERIAAAEALKPADYDPAFKAALDYENAKAAAVLAPPAPVAVAKPTPAEDESEAVKWSNSLCKAVPEFPEWYADEKFKSFLGSSIGAENLDDWRNDPAWAAAKVLRVRGEYDKAKQAEADAEATRTTNASSTVVPEGTKSSVPVGKPKLTTEQAAELMKTDPRFDGKSWAEQMALLETLGFKAY